MAPRQVVLIGGRVDSIELVATMRLRLDPTVPSVRSKGDGRRPASGAGDAKDAGSGSGSD